MSEVLVTRLLKSFDELDKCIELTKDVLSQKSEVPADVIQRVEQYSSIVNKQRGLAFRLRGFISEENWEEVSRHVKLINGLSTMIRDDAQAILSGSYNKLTAAESLAAATSDSSTNLL